jgi:hypothetical protein
MRLSRHRSIAALLCAVAFAACEKNAVQEITGPVSTARIKFFNFGVNAPGVNFYGNDTKLTAIGSTSCQGVTDTATVRRCRESGIESTTGVAVGGVGNGGFYSAIAPGQYTFAGKIAAATDKDLAVSSVQTAIAEGKAYSFYVSGFYNTTSKQVEGFIVEDVLPATIDYTTVSVRFVNAISNSSPMTLYAKNTTTNTEVPIGGSVAYKSGGAFVTIPPGFYDLNTRTAGSATNVITRTGVQFVAGRVYTIGARGDITVTSTTSANRPQLDNTANR